MNDADSNEGSDSGDDCLYKTRLNLNDICSFIRFVTDKAFCCVRFLFSVC